MCPPGEEGEPFYAYGAAIFRAAFFSLQSELLTDLPNTRIADPKLFRKLLCCERSLADHYNPLAMSPELLRAHATLDRAVDKVFGAKRSLHSNEERLAVFFESYVGMVS